jgi:Protein of unknown function (DUF2742)
MGTEEGRDERPPDEGAPPGATPGAATTIDTPDPARNQVAKPYGNATGRHCISSRQVSWWPVHEYVNDRLQLVGEWPTVGTPQWCALADGDPRKVAAVLDAAQHWALRLDALQEAHADASKAVSGAADWAAISSEINQRNKFRADHPWAKRVAS